MIAYLKKAKTAELEAELALFREALGEGNDVAAEFKNNGERVAEIERLVAAHGHPVKLDAEFIEANATLAKILGDAGAAEGDIVFAEEADLEQAKKLDAEQARRVEILAELERLEHAIDEDEAASLTTDELEVKLKEAIAATSNPVGGNTDTKGPETGAPGGDGATELIYQRKTVIRSEDVIVHGKSYKDVTVASGETFRISKEEYDAQVKPRE